MDLFGQTVIKKDYSATQGLNVSEFDLSSFANSIYFLQLQKEGMLVKTIRIVLEK